MMRKVGCFFALVLLGCSSASGSGGGAGSGAGGAAGNTGSGGGGSGSGGTAEGGSTGGKQVGDACTTNEDCTDPPDAECFTQSGPITFPNGYCSKACDVNSSEQECGSASCAAASLAGGSGSVTVSMCVAFCATNEECRVSEGYHCNLVLPGFGYCVPP